jgi:hypothetical protein
MILGEFSYLLEMSLDVPLPLKELIRCGESSLDTITGW